MASRHLHNKKHLKTKPTKPPEGPLREDDGRRAGPSRLTGCEESPATARAVSDADAPCCMHQPLDVFQHTVCVCHGAKLEAVQSHEAQGIVALSRVEGGLYNFKDRS